MHLPCYLVSSVTVVTSLLVHSRLLCGEGLGRQGCSTAERKKEGPGSCAHSNFFLAKSTLFSKLQTAALKGNTLEWEVHGWHYCTLIFHIEQRYFKNIDCAKLQVMNRTMMQNLRYMVQHSIQNYKIKCISGIAGIGLHSAKKPLFLT